MNTSQKAIEAVEEFKKFLGMDEEDEANALDIIQAAIDEAYDRGFDNGYKAAIEGGEDHEAAFRAAESRPASRQQGGAGNSGKTGWSPPESRPAQEPDLETERWRAFEVGYQQGYTDGQNNAMP